jgi:putative transposase
MYYSIERDWTVGKLKSLDLSNKKVLIDSKLNEISMTRQCELIDLNRPILYYEAKPINEYDIKVMKRLDEIYTDISSTYGYSFMHKQLLQGGFVIGVNKVNRLMTQMEYRQYFQENAV